MKKKTTRKTRTRGRQVVNSTKTKIDGILFASKLEGMMYTMLKKAGINFTYEGKSYVTFDPITLEQECWERATKKSKAMIDRRNVTKVSYTPDFIGENEEWFIECKGRANESFSIRWKLFKQRTAEMIPPPIIFKPTNKADCQQVIEILKQKGYATN